jgi:hypothetical protein
VTVRSFLQSSARAALTARLRLPGFEWPQCHDDGTVDYYCPQMLRMVRRVEVITPEALALLPKDEAERVKRHLDRHAGVCA